jgi:hypothetical protein
MQLKDLNWTVFGISLAVLFLVCLGYAALVRWGAKKGMEGQTAWAVVVGVTIILAAIIPTLGLESVVVMFCFFIVGGLPMIGEYVLRVNAAQRKDKENAQALAKDILK